MCHLQLLLFPFLKAIDEEVNKKEASFNPADNYSWEDPHAEVECDPNTQNAWVIWQNTMEWQLEPVEI